MIMRRIIIVFSLLVCCVTTSGQTSRSEIYEQKYDLLVSKFGPAGVGVETVLDNWEKVDSTNVRLMLARFELLFEKSRSTKVVSRSEKKYLGMEPLLTLKDSTGVDIYYYQESEFDDALYGQAVQALDKAIGTWPDKLDLRFVKANAYIAYEKESPDMALAYLVDLAALDAMRNRPWTYGGENVSEDFFAGALQEYCYTFFNIGTDSSMNAFRSLSEVMLEHYPKNPGFLNNIGSYHLSKADYKTARKCYSKVLKKHPDDLVAIKNSLIIARRTKDLKFEKKCLGWMVRYGEETDKAAAQARLSALEKER